MHDALLDLNNAHARETSLLTPAEWHNLVREAFSATCVGGPAALLIAFDQDADYHSPNFKWFQDRRPRFVYIDRIIVAGTLRGKGLAGDLYRDLFERARAARSLARELDELRREAETLPRHIAAAERLLPFLPLVPTLRGYTTVAFVLEQRYVHAGDRRLQTSCLVDPPAGMALAAVEVRSGETVRSWTATDAVRTNRRGGRDRRGKQPTSAARLPALAIEPGNPWALYRMGLASERAGKPIEAQRYYSRALKRAEATGNRRLASMVRRQMTEP